jgi:hypothetical protein
MCFVFQILASQLQRMVCLLNTCGETFSVVIGNITEDSDNMLCYCNVDCRTQF